MKHCGFNLNKKIGCMLWFKFEEEVYNLISKNWTKNVHNIWLISCAFKLVLGKYMIHHKLIYDIKIFQKTMKTEKNNNIEIFNKVSTLHIAMHYGKSCPWSLYFYESRTHKITRNNLVLSNFKLQVIWEHATWDYITNMNYLKLCSHLN